MPLVSNFEKLAQEEGLKEGIEKETNLVIRLLNKKKQ